MWENGGLAQTCKNTGDKWDLWVIKSPAVWPLCACDSLELVEGPIEDGGNSVSTLKVGPWVALLTLQGARGEVLSPGIPFDTG
jgi:hypothetical protein